jgi:hypothetical protein
MVEDLTTLVEMIEAGVGIGDNGKTV